MIGVDACQRSFCIAFAFLSGEDENDYIWALDQLQSIYELYDIRQPSVILTDRCLACINAISDEETFDQQVEELEKRFVPRYVKEVSYIRETWLDPYKEKLVKAWVDQYAHFGNVATSGWKASTHY
ncbi:MULE transposase [Hirsutella rhossiliensis]|uniref:MULE transposase domain-containing protein n=1 Tax=Hirsutella rhossiliensis TaxID=111463 RepID=A0A9P8N7F2_9HYPO|nr:MULE transposase domain-containing protein [Hirsutella rhossiliensis]KAH0968139.1 MULE transposase domain-containing protein [Hirsutella rhossiliensis]